MGKIIQVKIIEKKLIVQNIKKIIPDIPLLISKNNNEDNSPNTPKTRNYFNIEDIKKVAKCSKK